MRTRQKTKDMYKMFIQDNLCYMTLLSLHEYVIGRIPETVIKILEVVFTVSTFK